MSIFFLTELHIYFAFKNPQLMQHRQKKYLQFHQPDNSEKLRRSKTKSHRFGLNYSQFIFTFGLKSLLQLDVLDIILPLTFNFHFNLCHSSEHLF